MIPYFAANDLIMFYKYLNNCTTYFEFGCGGSTFQASSRTNIQKVYSVESDKDWVMKVINSVNQSKVTIFYTNLETKPKTWGYPGSNCTDASKKLYSDRILHLSPSLQEKIDLVLIDGRFRVACCLKTFNAVSSTAVIVFDDFLDRPHYFEVLNYFDVIDQTSDKRMAVLKKKAGIEKVSEDIIKKYELDHR